MKKFAGIGLLLAGVLALPAGAGLAFEAPSPDSTAQLVARGGGRGGGGRGGGSRGGSRGGGSRSGSRGGSRGGSRAHSGFKGSGGTSLNRGGSRPTGGWSRNVGGRSSPSLNRPTTRPASRPSGSRPGYANRPGSGNRPISNRPGSGTTLGNRRPGSPNISRQGDRNINRSGDRNFNRNINRNVDRNINRNVNRNIHRDWNRTVNINNVNLRPGWARPGWGYARPWNHGWYGGWSSPTWGWWGARAAVWGVGTLATAAIINSAVDSAVSSNVTYIVVPNSGYQLQFGTVEPYPAGTSGVRFIASLDGTSYQLSADCQRGYLNGREPATAAQAELVNAACQVAFGST